MSLVNGVQTYHLSGIFAALEGLKRTIGAGSSILAGRSVSSMKAEENLNLFQRAMLMTLGNPASRGIS